jgi:MFS family permease
MTKNPDSLWSPLSFSAFRWLWLGALAMNLAIWMQNVGAAWLMVSLSASPLLVALVQTAISLPSFFFGLPGGVFADIFNRRSYLLLTQSGMLLASLVLVACCAFGLISPWALLCLTFVFGIGFALQGPAWYTTQSESVPLPFMASAMALSSVSYSSARAIGPALAGGVVATSGITSVFVFCSVLLLISLVVIYRMKEPTRDNSLPPESLWAGLRGAVRYVRHSDVMLGQCVRTVAFVGAASGLWALLPVVANETGGGAGGYGLLLGSIGAGTMVAAFLLPTLRAKLEINVLVGASCVVYAATSLVVALVPNTTVQCAALFLAGLAWMFIGTLNLVAIQSAVAPWIRARAVAIYMLVFQGALAIGGAIWGGLATHIGTHEALIAASLGVALSLLAMLRYRARLGEEAEVTPSNIGVPVFSFEELGPQDGPVAVQIAYRILPENREEFLREVRALGVKRKRDGAGFWRIYRELENPTQYLERFVVDSWSDYLRQQTRATLADQEIELRVKALHAGDKPPAFSHFISETLPSNPS